MKTLAVSKDTRFVVLRYLHDDLRRVTTYSVETSYEAALAVRERWMSNSQPNPQVSYTIITMTGFGSGWDVRKVVGFNLLRVMGYPERSLV